MDLLRYVGLTPVEAIEQLKCEGIVDYKITKLVNDKQQSCDTEVVLCVRIADNPPFAQIITTVFKHIF